MAKIFMTAAFAGISGKVGEGVYMPTSKQGMSYLRTYIYPTLTANNHLQGSSIANLASLWKTQSAPVQTDFANYAQEYHAIPLYSGSRQERAYSGFALWVKMFYAWKKSDPIHVDLATCTVADFVLGTNVQALKDAVTESILPATPNSNDYGALFLQ